MIISAYQGPRTRPELNLGDVLPATLHPGMPVRRTHSTTPIPPCRNMGRGFMVCQNGTFLAPGGVNGLGAHVIDWRQNKGLGVLGATESTTNQKIWMWLSAASSAASAYHGYKRNQSIGWAIGWALLGGMFPVIVPAIAVAQGFGKKA